MYTLSDIFEGNYPISQKYNARPEYYQQFGLKGHEGVDWATPVGVWLLNPFTKGQVLRTGYDPIYGYYIVVWDQSQKCAVWYCHLSSINVSPGQILTKGARVGKTGSSGNTQGAHLHVSFCETDQYANRLNQNNGYLGFIDILGSKVKWELAGSTPVLTDAQKVAKVKEILYGGKPDSDTIYLLKQVIK